MADKHFNLRAPDIRMVIASLEGGGAERVCLRLANQWAKEGKRIEILLVKKRGIYLEKLDPQVEILSAEKLRTLHAIPWLIRRLMSWPRVPVLVFGLDLGAGLGGAKTMGLLRVPLIYREGSLPRRNVPQGRLWSYPWFVAKVDGLVAQTKYALRQLEDLGVRPQHRTVIWNPSEPIESELPTKGPNGAALPAPLRLVAVGRLSPEKGMLRLIDGFAAYAQLHPAATLTLAGGGPQRAELEAKVARLGLTARVQFLGFIPEVSRIYQGSDMLVLPSLFEGLPNVILEALHHGCPVVAAGGPGVGEVLHDLGLAECWWDGTDFVRDYPGMVERVWQLPEKKWQQARQLLEAKTRDPVVAAAYFEFCREVARMRSEEAAV